MVSYNSKKQNLEDHKRVMNNVTVPHTESRLYIMINIL